MKGTPAKFDGDSKESDSKKAPVVFSKIRIIKNAAVLSVSFSLLFTGYIALTLLQTTMNGKGGIGAASQAVMYAVFCISSLLLPKYVIKKLGSKNALILSMMSYIPYVASNFYPHWIIVVVSAAVAGIGSPLLFGSQCAYLNYLCTLYTENVLITENCNDDKEMEKKCSEIVDTSQNKADQSQTPEAYSTHSSTSGESFVKEFALKREHLPFRKIKRLSLRSAKSDDSITARFFGVHGMAFLSSYVWSNLISFHVLQRDISHDDVYNASCACGANFCNVESKCSELNLQEPSTDARNTLTAICVSLCVFSIFLVIVLLDKLEAEQTQTTFSFALLTATCKLARNKKLLLLIPSSFYVGMLITFYLGDFTKSYIGCAWGIHHVGLVSICYGITSAFSATISGWLVRRLGREPIFVTAYLVSVTTDILLLQWQPTPKQPFMFFLISGMWGICVGVFWSHFPPFFGILFKSEKEAATANFYLWYSIGYATSFAYNNHICTYLKIYLLLAVSLVGILGYLTVEISLRLKK